MTDKAKLDEIHARVTAWSEEVHADPQKMEELQNDPVFVEMVQELMQLPMDDMLYLMMKSIDDEPALGALLMDDIIKEDENGFVIDESKLDGPDKLS